MFRKFFPINLTFTTGITVASLLFSSCGGHEENTDLKDIEVTTDTISSEVRINFDLIRVNIPPPAELTGKLSAAKINYNKTFLLSSSKSGSFSSNYQKAIGMGVFGADLGIAAAYNQPQDALEYLTQISKLAGDLGISSAFDPEFTKQLLSSINKPDTFQLMLDKAFEKAERNLRSNQRIATTILMVTGGWVESLYISVEGLNSNPTNPKVQSIYRDIVNHCHTFEYIFQLLDAYKTNTDCAKLIQDLEPAKAELNSIGNNPKMGSDALPKLRETVTALRNKITS